MPPPRCCFALLAMCFALLPACGQKGPLYLPDTNGTVVTRPTQTPSAPPSPAEPAPPDEQAPAPPVDPEQQPSGARDGTPTPVPTPR